MLLLFFILFLFLCGALSAQPNPVYSGELEEVLVLAHGNRGVLGNESFAVGSLVQEADSATLSLLRHHLLADYLSLHTAVYVREAGSGMTSSVSFRGMAASHASVSWNGIVLNPLTMGQPDFNQLPMNFFDGIIVHSGGNGALYGNGSIGGSVNLLTKPSWNSGIRGEFQQTLGSFGYHHSSGDITAGNERWESKTRWMYQWSDNDFEFHNTAKFEAPTERQQNAGFRNYGLLQEIYHRPSAREEWSLKVWYARFFRETQPTMGENGLPGQYDDISDKALRALLSYRQLRKISWNANIGYIYDGQHFRDDLIATHRTLGVWEAQTDVSGWLTLKGGVHTEYIIPDVDAYLSDVREWRTDAYLLALLRLGNRWEGSVNMRQGWVSKVSVPFTPSLGLSYLLWQSAPSGENEYGRNVPKQAADRVTGVQSVKLRGTVARCFRVPTLNDRYWGESGRVDLRPENGLNIEGGADYRFENFRSALTLGATLFHNRVDNWIMWLPRGHVWKPGNFQKVDARGVEGNLGYERVAGLWKVRSGASYAFTRSVVREGMYPGDPRTGMQLTGQPRHRLSALLYVQRTPWSLHWNYSFTGARNSSDRNMVMPAYALTHVTGAYHYQWGKNAVDISLRINNLFDKEYQDMMFFAMPGRNVQVSVRYSFQ